MAAKRRYELVCEGAAARLHVVRAVGNILVPAPPQVCHVVGGRVAALLRGTAGPIRSRHACLTWRAACRAGVRRVRTVRALQAAVRRTCTGIRARRTFCALGRCRLESVHFNFLDVQGAAVLNERVLQVLNRDVRHKLCVRLQLEDGGFHLGGEQLRHVFADVCDGAAHALKVRRVHWRDQVARREDDDRGGAPVTGPCKGLPPRAIGCERRLVQQSHPLAVQRHVVRHTKVRARVLVAVDSRHVKRTCGALRREALWHLHLRQVGENVVGGQAHGARSRPRCQLQLPQTEVAVHQIHRDCAPALVPLLVAPRRSDVEPVHAHNSFSQALDVAHHPVRELQVCRQRLHTDPKVHRRRVACRRRRKVSAFRLPLFTVGDVHAASVERRRQVVPRGAVPHGRRRRCACLARAALKGGGIKVLSRGTPNVTLARVGRMRQLQAAGLTLGLPEVHQPAQPSARVARRERRPNVILAALAQRESAGGAGRVEGGVLRSRADVVKDLVRGARFVCGGGNFVILHAVSRARADEVRRVVRRVAGTLDGEGNAAAAPAQRALRTRLHLHFSLPQLIRAAGAERGCVVIEATQPQLPPRRQAGAAQHEDPDNRPHSVSSNEVQIL
eukprot:Rhum_TRINITY_DN2342_c0_g1::Rhum_TRINITY_DN2342_c0_g1_i1::g.6973::m.6973